MEAILVGAKRGCEKREDVDKFYMCAMARKSVLLQLVSNMNVYISISNAILNG